MFTIYYDKTQHAIFFIHVVYHYWIQYNKLYTSTGYSITTACGIVFMLCINTGDSTSCTPKLVAIQQQRLAMSSCCIPAAATVQLYVVYQYWQQYNNMLCTSTVYSTTTACGFVFMLYTSTDDQYWLQYNNGVWICLHVVY